MKTYLSLQPWYCDVQDSEVLRRPEPQRTKLCEMNTTGPFSLLPLSAKMQQLRSCLQNEELQGPRGATCRRVTVTWSCCWEHTAKLGARVLQAVWAVSGVVFCVCKLGYYTAASFEPVGACALDVIRQKEISKPSTVRAGIIHGKRPSPGGFSEAQCQGGKGIQRLEPGKAVRGSRVRQLLLPASQGWVQLIAPHHQSGAPAHSSHGHVPFLAARLPGKAGSGSMQFS